jgi:ABC-type uncharacterized transport system ATPase subunit
MSTRSADGGSSGHDPNPPAAIAAVAVTKRFPGVVANDRVDFTLRRGEVHTLLGENGAGKSTLAALLCGLYQPDEGHILRDGAPVRLRSPRDGLARGIGMVHQHFRLVDRFTVAENVVLGDDRQSQLLQRGEIDERVAALGEKYGLSLDPSAEIHDLTVGQRQRVEIVKMLYRGVDVLLLDEPTAVLTPTEADALFETVRAMTAEGRSVVFISHKLGEVMDVSDRVTVMRGGRVTGEVATRDATQRELAELMVGRPVIGETRRSSGRGDLRLHASGVTVISEGRRVLDGVDVEVATGEILGIAGVSGNGQRELAEVLAGVEVPESGSVSIDGVELGTEGPRHARELGVAFVPEDRLGVGLVPSLSLVDNMLLTRPRGFIVDRSAARREVEDDIERFEIKAPGPDAEARVLSGGNAQKVLLARELGVYHRLESPKVLIVSSPTRGLDVGAAEFVRGLLHEASEAGAAIVLISEDLDEIIGLADRVAVLYRGEIALEGETDALAYDQIGLAMAGVSQ